MSHPPRPGDVVVIDTGRHQGKHAKLIRYDLVNGRLRPVVDIDGRKVRVIRVHQFQVHEEPGHHFRVERHGPTSYRLLICECGWKSGATTTTMQREKQLHWIAARITKDTLGSISFPA